MPQEERPPYLTNVGMVSRLLQFYRKLSPDDAGGPTEVMQKCFFLQTRGGGSVPPSKDRIHVGRFLVSRSFIWQNDVGEVVRLDADEPSPFSFGEIPPGKVVAACVNELFQAPVYQAPAPTSDFLVIRCVETIAVVDPADCRRLSLLRQAQGALRHPGSWQRVLCRQCAACPARARAGLTRVGRPVQAAPFAARIQDLSRQGTPLNKCCLVSFSRIDFFFYIQKAKDDGEGLTLDDIKEQLPFHSETAIRKRLKAWLATIALAHACSCHAHP